MSEKWYQKLDLPEDPRENGSNYTAEQVTVFRVPKLADLLGYAQAVRSRTVECLNGIAPDKFDEIIQHPEFREITVGKLVSYMLCEITQHIGQIGCLRGLQRGLDK